MKNLIREGGKTLTLRHMKIFTTVYRCGSVTRAAQELHLAQPSLSVAIRELEEHYGVRLFERTGRAICPTQAAGALYGYASHIVSLFDDMEKQMRNWDTLGVLRLGASVTIGTHILPELIRRYQARVPQLRIEALVEQSSGIERKLLDNEIDIGLIETQPEQPELLAIPFLRDELCAIVPLGSALAQKTSVTLRELSEYPFLMREPGKRRAPDFRCELFAAADYRAPRLAERQHAGDCQRCGRRAGRCGSAADAGRARRERGDCADASDRQAAGSGTEHRLSQAEVSDAQHAGLYRALPRTAGKDGRALGRHPAQEGRT